MNKKISIIIPCFNEQENIDLIVTEILEKTKQFPYCFEVVFIDDGSEDGTLAEVQKQSLKHLNVFYLELSKNFGKDQAIRAGLSVVNGDAIITMDADLQHPVELLATFIDYWEHGYEVVYTYREKTNPHVKWKQKLLSKAYYKIMNFLSSVELENGIADFRLIDRKVLDALKLIKENDVFYRGMVKWVGYRQKGISYQPNKRRFGEISYSVSTLTRLAVSSVMSFSVKPLIVATVLGLSFSFLALLFVPYILFSYLAGYAVSGWTSIITTIVFFGGLQLFILGTISLYLSKLYMQSKCRPNSLLRNTNYLSK